MGALVAHRVRVSGKHAVNIVQVISDGNISTLACETSEQTAHENK
jgi:hypothetical protein